MEIDNFVNFDNFILYEKDKNAAPMAAFKASIKIKHIGRGKDERKNQIRRQ